MDVVVKRSTSKNGSVFNMIIEWLLSVYQIFQQSPTKTQLIVVAIAAVLIMRWATKKRYKLPPGPPPLPLLGSILDIRGVTLTDKFDEWKNKYGPVVSYYIGPKLTVVLNDIDSMNEAYVKRGSDFSSRPLTHSLKVTSDGFKGIAFAPYSDLWKLQRKIGSQALRQYLTGRQLEIRVHETLQPIIERLLQENGAFDPHRYISLSVCNVLYGLCFGKTLHLDDPRFLWVLSTFDQAADDLGGGFLEDHIPPLRWWWPSKEYTESLAIQEEFNNFTLQRLQEHKASFNPEKINSLTDHVILSRQNALEEDENGTASLLTDLHLKQILADVFAAGVDTSRFTLDWLFLVLVAYPDVQTKIQEEIDRVVGEEVPGKEHRSKLVYTEAVLMEVMRLYYVAPMGIPHKTLRDTTVGGYDIPAETTVLGHVGAMMCDPKNWSDPLKFKPERFMVSKDGGGDKTVSYRHDIWAPFSMGHRACLGESLAKLELVYLVVGLLQKLTFSYAGKNGEKFPDLRYKTTGFMMLPKPYCVTVTSRKK